jgi:hypothetical protein
MKIEFTCANDTLLKHWVPRSAGEFLPDWFENVPRYEINDFFSQGIIDNIKACTPVVDMINAGYIVPCCREFRLETKLVNFRKEMIVHYVNVAEPIPGSTKISPGLKDLKVFNERHLPCFDKQFKKVEYFKFTSEWGVITPPGYSSLILQPFYHNETRYKIFPAILDTDKYHKGIIIAGTKLSDDDVTVRPGDPLVQVIPFKREDWTMEVRKGNCPDPSKFYFREGYKKLFHSLKKFI